MCFSVSVAYIATEMAMSFWYGYNLTLKEMSVNIVCDDFMLSGAKVWRQKGLVWHYGVVMPSGQIAHLSPAGLRTSLLREFAEGRQVFTDGHYVEPILLLDRFAMAQPLFKTYRLFSGNCEHFASYMQKGLGESKQASTVVAFGVGGVLIGACNDSPIKGAILGACLGLMLANAA